MLYLVVGLFIILLLRLVRTSNSSQEGSGKDLTGVVGLVGKATQTFTTDGTVEVRGEIWKATSKRGIVREGDRVRVVKAAPGLLLEVEIITGE